MTSHVSNVNTILRPGVMFIARGLARARVIMAEVPRPRSRTPSESAPKLEALFRQIGRPMSMDTFDEKVAVQKIAYLAQTRDIDLGYEFEWYLRGPYCRQVSEDARSDKGAGPGLAGLSADKIGKFAEYLKPHMQDAEWLEIAASLIYLKENHYQKYDLDSVYGYLIDDLTYGYKNFPTSRVHAVLESIRQEGWI